MGDGAEGWEAGPSAPLLPPDEVHLWRVPLRPAADVLRRLHPLLSGEEQARAARYRFDVHRERFVAGRGAQRLILARYLGVDPSAIRYRESEHGKPALDGPGAETGIRFNVSNSDDAALLSLVLEREIGVDLEPLRPIEDGPDIATRFFSAPEVEVFRGVPEAQRDAAFLTCWTRKEAFIKAVGEGLSMPLDRFDVTLLPGSPARLLATRGDPGEAGRWTMRELDLGPDWLGALCVAGPPGWTLRRFDWRWEE